MICKPKDKGGLGILNLSVQNNALLLKHLHKFYNHDSTPWVQLIWDSYYYETVPHAVTLAGSFWWKSIIKLSDQYRLLTKCAVGNGSSILFWSDLWGDQIFAGQFDRLFSFAKDKLQSIKDFMGADSLLQNFHLPLSIEAHDELIQLQDLLNGFQLHPDNNDSWVFNSGKGIFRPNLVYKQHFNNLVTHHPSCAIWKSKCTSKHKFFAWLILHDRINTKGMILRRHWKVTDNNDCVLCSAHVMEDWRHLFFNCMFSTRIWNYLQIPWNPGDTVSSLLAAKSSFKGPCFFEIVIISCWCIWKQRNGWIFKNIRPTFRGWKSSFFHEVSLLLYRIKKDNIPLLSSWLASLP
jgi:hypothetical protein